MGTKSDDIKAAFSMLDHDNDAVWTAAGLPKVETVVAMTGDATITREDITEATGADGVRMTADERATARAKLSGTDRVEAAGQADPRMKPRAEVVPGLTREQITAAQMRKAALDEQISQMDSKIRAHQEIRNKLNLERDAMTLALEAATHVNAADTIKSYQASQIAQAIARKAQLDVIAAITKGPTGKVTTLDNAMALKHGKRPSVPSMASGGGV